MKKLCVLLALAASPLATLAEQHNAAIGMLNFPSPFPCNSEDCCFATSCAVSVGFSGCLFNSDTVFPGSCRSNMENPSASLPVLGCESWQMTWGHIDAFGTVVAVVGPETAYEFVVEGCTSEMSFGDDGCHTKPSCETAQLCGFERCESGRPTNSSTSGL
ncbi:uncharacterized protein LTR77_008052 [Saxophila tyrrhenica]|uniref:Uncharacterized protein n=1 Tax=Saxophila tyrrhenica TaxID=1690608 RepID=A0AAV9P5P4_9PEZI|nr:hypothetical protein LTR77_008052 [Saxophila tyrrhenica]